MGLTLTGAWFTPAAGEAGPKQQPAPHAQTTRSSPSVGDPAPPPPDAAGPLRLDMEAKTLDLDAVVVGRDAEWLELVASSPNSREHESLVTVAAKPSRIHAALLTLGLVAGEPLQPELDPIEHPDTAWLPPSGDAVTLHFVVEGTEVPASAWIQGQAAPEYWVFAGSRIRTFRGRAEYLADLNGTVASLVSFGDDLLAPPGTVTDADDGQAIQPASERMPPNGTAVVLRVRRAPTELDTHTQPEATTPGSVKLDTARRTADSAE